MIFTCNMYVTCPTIPLGTLAITLASRNPVMSYKRDDTRWCAWDTKLECSRAFKLYISVHMYMYIENPPK